MPEIKKKKKGSDLLSLSLPSSYAEGSPESKKLQN